MPNNLTVDLTITPGEVLRLAMLMTHYRKPLDVSHQRIAEARKALIRWGMACQPNNDPPPEDFIQVLADDLNTPGAIAKLHQYRAAKEGRKLFAALRFLGFFSQVNLPADLPGGDWKAEVI